MMADLVLESGLSERQLLEDCGADVLDAMVDLINERRRRDGGGDVGRSAQGARMLQELRGAS
jgi:hypothetical protein